MRLLFSCSATVLFGLSIVGCAGFPGSFADREVSSRNGERDRILADINTRMSQGDFEGARRLMDQLDPQARAQADSRRQSPPGVETAAGVEQTSFQNNLRNRTLPNRNPGPSQQQPAPKTERELIIQELLSMAPPNSYQSQRRLYETFELSQLQGMLFNLRRTHEIGQPVSTFSQTNGPGAAPPLPPGMESAAVGPSPNDAPEPGASRQATGIPGVGFPIRASETLAGTGTGAPGGDTGVTIQPAGGALPSGGVIMTSGIGPAAGGPLPLIAGRDNPFPSDNLQPTINPGQAGLVNPVRNPETGNPAVIIPRLDNPNDANTAPNPGHSQLNGAGAQNMPLPPYPDEEASQPGVFSQNLTRIQRAGETIAARVWGQPEVPVESGPAGVPASPLAAAIVGLENDLLSISPEESTANKMEYQRKAVALRALYLAQGQYERAIEPMQGIDSRDREFWQQMFWAMSNHLDAESIPEPNARAAETITQLREAMDRLRDKADLRLRNVTFCHSIVSFGNYERFSRDQFTTGQPVLLYAEVDNFSSKQLDDSQFQTALRSNVEIYPYGDRDAPAIASIPFDVTRDVCRNVRRDYFHSYEFTIPEDLEPGRYTLVLQVSDQLSGKYATQRVEFEVESPRLGG